MKTFIALCFLTIALVFSVDTLYTWDSQYYIRASQTIGEGMRNRETVENRLADAYPANGYYVAWTPLYPLLLAAGQMVLSLDTTVRLINALALAGILWVLYQRPLPLFVRLALMLGALAVLQPNWNKALSDVPFLAMVAWFIHALDTRQPITRLIAIVALATLLRYTGVTLIAAGFIVLWLRGQRRDALVFAVGAFAPLAVWLVRNHALTGTFMGERSPASTPAWQTVRAYLETVGFWALAILIHLAGGYGFTYLVRRLFVLHRRQRTHNRVQYPGRARGALAAALAGVLPTRRS